MKKYTFQQSSISEIQDCSYIQSIAHIHNNPSWSFPFHRHQDLTDITFIKSGEGKYAVGNQWIPIRQGDLLILKPGTIHAIISSENNPLDIWILAFSNFDHACRIVGFNEVPFNEVSGFIDTGEKSVSIGLLIESIARQGVDSENQFYINYHLTLALTKQIVDFFFKASAIPLQETNYIADATLAYIDDFYFKDVTLNVLSHKLHASCSCISHELTSYYGVSPIKSLIDRRIGRAQWLLASTDMTFTRIAQSVGYDNLTHFSNLFINRTGMTHRQFREQFFESESSAV